MGIPTYKRTPFHNPLIGLDHRPTPKCQHLIAPHLRQPNIPLILSLPHLLFTWLWRLSLFSNHLIPTFSAKLRGSSHLAYPTTSLVSSTMTFWCRFVKRLLDRFQGSLASHHVMTAERFGFAQRYCQCQFSYHADIIVVARAWASAGMQGWIENF